jgi:hypothetical protein
VVTPTAKVEPDAGVQANVALASQMSETVGAKVTTAPPPPVQVVVMFAGQMIDGGVVSTTVTIRSAWVAGLPLLSLTL